MSSGAEISKGTAGSDEEVDGKARPAIDGGNGDETKSLTKKRSHVSKPYDEKQNFVIYVPCDHWGLEKMKPIQRDKLTTYPTNHKYTVHRIEEHEVPTGSGWKRVQKRVRGELYYGRREVE
uniref:Uncharacterized protein n=1 Tax=Odontella aurita TaxID=265563 RepID=A0A7S4HKR4_9STRA|mmetsp:Transcript_11539/g.34011  ORF Transcript_11539/g.34011 Transcript_11539/m.34011 type:complete len:121 (+) Transcript_11539:169-531(+)|eukprot:CAMPEP_0113525964 /NCGR_PEP_ID=MMETSP0015_2-20120614/476_1 /TAXON_ID=2838 /ORGANISM="Odontella" /LENGTH=120 /DNA_ID=CAMNT_0000424233 /DNA_START=111 /DNA_END=473 /DNA_ORIENTATION=- /assembly_acc=CAM_ASM_000160